MSGMPAFDGPTDRGPDGCSYHEEGGRPRGPTDQVTLGPSDRRTARHPDPTIIAESPAMRRAVALARQFAITRLPVLIVGETGTGKEVLAQAIHRWSGRRGEMVDVDCGAIPPGMVTNELFGHRRGAYTGALETTPGLLYQADGGTLFLDELASLSGEGQAALLRVLETGEVRRVGDRDKRAVDLRLIAAVQVEPRSSDCGRFVRPDLYHRLAGKVIRLPPLRERPEDLPPLARHFAALHSAHVEDSARFALTRYDWPGNVRELRHVVARAVALSDGRTLDARAVAEALDLGTGRGIRVEELAAAEAQAWQHERERVGTLIRQHGGKPLAIAAALGVSRATLYRRLNLLRLHLGEARRSQARYSVSPLGETSHETA
jgi:DNA-binding NtrC family response regulator